MSILHSLTNVLFIIIKSMGTKIKTKRQGVLNGTGMTLFVHGAFFCFDVGQITPFCKINPLLDPQIIIYSKPQISPPNQSL